MINVYLIIFAKRDKLNKNLKYFLQICKNFMSYVMVPRQTPANRLTIPYPKTYKLYAKRLSNNILYARELFKLSLTALAALFLAGCGGGEKSGNDDYLSRFLSDLPPLDTSNYTVVFEGKSVDYFDGYSQELAKALDASISAGDFNLTYQNIDWSGFSYGYELNDLLSEGLDGAYIMINGYIGSHVHMKLVSDNGSMPNSRFEDIFGKIDDSLLAGAKIETNYGGDMSAEFFDISDLTVDCNIGGTAWSCEKDDGNTRYGFEFTSYESESLVVFYKDLYISYSF